MNSDSCLHFICRFTAVIPVLLQKLDVSNCRLRKVDECMMRCSPGLTAKNYSVYAAALSLVRDRKTMMMMAIPVLMANCIKGKKR
jgi:hypothetical protein